MLDLVVGKYAGVCRVTSMFEGYCWSERPGVTCADHASPRTLRVA